MSNPKSILVFSDPHGRLTLVLRLVWQWQRETGRRADLILVAGDLGVWPDVSRLDSSTRKHSRSDPAELGFMAFQPIFASLSRLDSKPVVTHLSRCTELLERVLPELVADVVFVGGNHEDYEYLGACAAAIDKTSSAEIGRATTAAAAALKTLCNKAAGNSPLVPVERSGRIWWLPPGTVLDMDGIRITGISGIDPAGCGRDPSRYHSASVITDKSVIDATLNALEAVGDEGIDVLLTHDGLPDAAKPGKGTLKLLEPIVALNPRFHLFGHYHSAIAPISYAQWLPTLASWYPQVQTICQHPEVLRTTGIHLNKLGFDRQTHALRNQVMGRIDVDESGAWRFDFVDAPWLAQITNETMWHTGTSDGT